MSLKLGLHFHDAGNGRNPDKSWHGALLPHAIGPLGRSITSYVGIDMNRHILRRLNCAPCFVQETHAEV
jgi:hypothetical protein